VRPQELRGISNAFANRHVELEKKELKLLDLIQSLGEYLNHEEGSFRAKSTCSSTILDS
jgi:hypothetical protein